MRRPTLICGGAAHDLDRDATFVRDRAAEPRCRVRLRRVIVKDKDEHRVESEHHFDMPMLARMKPFVLPVGRNHRHAQSERVRDFLHQDISATATDGAKVSPVSGLAPSAGARRQRRAVATAVQNSVVVGDQLRLDGLKQPEARGDHCPISPVAITADDDVLGHR